MTGSAELEQKIRAGLAAKDRDDMGPTVAYFHALLRDHPGNALVLYEVGGAHDTAGEEEQAVHYYEQALAAGLDGDVLRRCLLQYGSTLRNLERHEESLAVLRQAREQFPDSDSVRVFLALSRHAAGHADAAVADLLELVADRVGTAELQRYAAAIRGNADYLRERDTP